ncbi:MAG: helicase-related protein [Limnochordia bacterium]|jgi:competence protein ComFA
MLKLQIISTTFPAGHKLWVARDPQGISQWSAGSGRHRAMGQPLPGDEVYQRLSVLQARGPLGSLARLAAALGSQGIAPGPGLGDPGHILAAGLGILQEAVAGRIVFQDRLVSLLRDEGLWPLEAARLLDYASYHGLVEQLPGISRLSWGALRCNRCGGQNVVFEPCPVCRRRECPLCTDCLTLGASRGCRILVSAPFSGKAFSGEADFTLAYQLTPAQVRAAAQLEEFWQSPSQRTLVWAACGAGKTEVTYPLMRRALREGHQVLFAVPRQDVVRELAERFRSAFTGVEIAVHYGGQPWQAQGQLVIATTHQVLHFYQRFGLAILDEVDAFPYHGSEMLRFGLIRALGPKGKLVEMSATPNPVPRKGTAVTIPVRHHGYPLPEPEFVKSRSGEIPPAILKLIEESPHQWIVFVPTVAACEELAAALREKLREKVAACHSRHPQRHEEIKAFRYGEKRIIVATAVLERGVTFPGVQVVVVDADHPVFSRSALVQMAGRVGRTADHPSGTVVLCGTRKNGAIKGAQAMIKQLNQEGAELGLLKGEGYA